MQHLQGGAQFFDTGGKGTGDHLSRLHTKNGPQPFAASENAVAHRPMNGNWMLGGRWQQALQCRVGHLSTGLQGVIEHDGEYSKCPLVFAATNTFQSKKDAWEGVLGWLGSVSTRLRIASWR